MRFLPGYASALLLVNVGLFSATGCGSEVNGSGGSGSGSSSTSSSSTGGDPISAVQACNDHCHKLDTLMCSFGGDCMTQCDAILANVPSECQDEAAAYYNCAWLNTTTCDEPLQCDTLQQALTTCVETFGCSPDGSCFGGGGMNGEMSCGCDQMCKGKKYSTNCTTPAGGGMATCDCLVDDMSVGTCQMANPGGCGPKETCCNTDYFKL